MPPFPPPALLAPGGLLYALPAPDRGLKLPERGVTVLYRKAGTQVWYLLAALKGPNEPIPQDLLLLDTVYEIRLEPSR